MKRAIYLVLVMLCGWSLAFAEGNPNNGNNGNGNDGSQGNANGNGSNEEGGGSTSCDTSCSTTNNTFVEGEGDTQRQAFGWGPEVDVIVFKSDNPLVQNIKVNTSYDVHNRETRVFGAVTVDLFGALTGK